MKLSCSSQSMDRLFLSGVMDIPGFIAYCTDELGLDGVEIEDKHFASTDTAYLDTLRSLLTKYGIEISNLAFFNSFGYPDAQKNLDEVERSLRWMDAAVALGSANFRLFAGWMGGPDQEIGFKGSILPKTPQAWETMVRCVGMICTEAAKRGLNAVIENHNHGGFLSVSDDVLRLFNEVRADNLSLLLDTGNYADGIPGIEKTLHLVKHHVHLKCRDIQADGSDAAFDLVRILEIIRDADFSGNLSIEYEGVQNEREILPRLLGFVRKKLGK